MSLPWQYFLLDAWNPYSLASSWEFGIPWHVVMEVQGDYHELQDLQGHLLKQEVEMPLTILRENGVGVQDPDVSAPDQRDGDWREGQT